MAKHIGKVVQVIGPVVDVRFDGGKDLPNIYDALHIKREDGTVLILETQQLIGEDTVRAVSMGRQNYLRIVGVVENMSEFVTPTGERFAIFGSGGGRRLAQTVGAPLLASIPIETAVATGGDSGAPIALGEGAAAEAFQELARVIAEDVAPPVDLTGCSARLLDAVDAALSAHDADQSSRLDVTAS